MSYWLLKSEPQTFSIDDLVNAKHQSTFWEGVRNYQARNTLQREMKVGDRGFFYHSSCPVPGIAGIVEITQVGLPDPTAFDPQSPYFDPKSTPNSPRWYMVEVKLIKKFQNLLSLTKIRQTSGLEGFTLLRSGNRLSVFSVSTKEWRILNDLSRKPHVITK